MKLKAADFEDPVHFCHNFYSSDKSDDIIDTDQRSRKTGLN